MKARIIGRLWKRLLPGGPWTPATCAELRVLTNYYTKAKGWTLTDEDVDILLERMRTHSPSYRVGCWAFMWGDPQLCLFEDSRTAREIAPLTRTSPASSASSSAAE